MSVNFYQYHPGALLESISDQDSLASQFQNEVLQDEQNFIDYVSSYGLKDQFVDANGELTLAHLPDDAQTFLKILENRLKRAGKDFLPEINRLTYNPPRQLSSTVRTAASYTDQIRGTQTSSSVAPKKSATDLGLLKLRDDFFDAILGTGTNEKSIENILRQLDTPSKQQTFRGLVIDDPRAQKYKGVARVEDILAQELSGRALGRAAAQLSVPDGETLFLRSLNSPTSQNLAAASGLKNPASIFSLSTEQIKQTGNPDLMSATEDLLKDIRTLAAESIRSGVFSFDLSSRELETKFTLGHLLMLKNIFGKVRFQIEQMQNLATHMQDAGQGHFFNSRSQANMQNFDAAKKQLEAALAGLGSVASPENAAQAMQNIAKASGNMLRESILFKEQENEGLSQYEANARAGELGAYTVIGACVVIGTMGYAGAALGGTGAMGLGGLTLTNGSLATATGIVTGGTAQTAAHFSAVKFGGSEDMSFTEIARGAFQEQFMTGLGVLTGAQLGRVFMSAEKLQHLQKTAPRVAQALEGATSNVAIGGEHAFTQMEIDPYVVGLWALSGVLNRGVLSGIDDAIEGSAQITLARKLAGATGVLAKDISLEAGEEVLETLIAEGYITPDQVIQSTMAALQELGSSESLTKAVVKSMGSGLDIGQQISEQTPPWMENETGPPTLPDAAIQNSPYTHPHLVRHNPPPKFLHALHNIKHGLTESDSLFLGTKHAQGFPFGHKRNDLATSHAKIIFSRGQWLIQGLSSSHKTFINNELVQSPRRVRAGNLIRLGPEMEFVFPSDAEIEGAPKEPQQSDSTKKSIKKQLADTWDDLPPIRESQSRTIPNAFVPDAHVMTAHRPANFETLAREFGTDTQTLISVLDQDTSTEQGYYRLQDGSLQKITGTTSNVDSEIFMTGDEDGVGTVDGGEVLFHTHGKESPEPSREDLQNIIARARLNPGVEQKQMSLGFVNGEKSGVAVLAEFDPETGTTHLSFLATAHARENMDQQKLDELATQVDAELSTLSQTDLALRAHFELGNGQPSIPVDRLTGLPIVAEAPATNKAGEYLLEGIRRLPDPVYGPRSGGQTIFSAPVHAAMQLNHRLLSGDRQAITDGGIYYVHEAESIGGNAGPNKEARHMYINKKTGQIIAVGLFTSLPRDIISNPDHALIKVIIDHSEFFKAYQKLLKDHDTSGIRITEPDLIRTLTGKVKISGINGLDEFSPEIQTALKTLIGKDFQDPIHVGRLDGRPEEQIISRQIGHISLPQELKTKMVAMQNGSDSATEIMIGRKSDSPLSPLLAEEMSVSRQQGVLIYDRTQDKWFYKNLSKNGSVIDGVKIIEGQTHELNENCILEIGYVKILIELPYSEKRSLAAAKEQAERLRNDAASTGPITPVDPDAPSKRIQGDGNENGFLPGTDTLQNAFHDSYPNRPKLRMSLNDSSALKRNTTIDIMPSGVRLTPINASDPVWVVAAYLKQNSDVPQRRIVVDLKDWVGNPNDLDPGTLNALAKIHNITIEIHIRKSDGGVEVQEFLSVDLAKKREEAARKGTTGELRKYQEPEPTVIPDMPEIIFEQMKTADEVFLDDNLTNLGWRKIPGGVIGARAKLSHNQGKWTLENLSNKGIVIHFRNGQSILLNQGETTRLSGGDVVYANRNQSGEPDPQTGWKFEAPTVRTAQTSAKVPIKPIDSSPNFLTNYLDRFFANYFSNGTGPIDDVTLTDLQDQLQWVEDDVDVQNMADFREPYYHAYRNPEPNPTLMSLSIDVGIQNLNVLYNGAGILAPRLYSIWLEEGSTPNTDDIGRFYFAVRGTHAKAFAEALVAIFKQAKQQGIDFSFKIPNEQKHYNRADAGVLYFDAKNQEWMYKKIIEMATSHPEWFRNRTPHFTANVLDEQSRPINGVAFAMDPQVGGSSFGGTISSCIARAVRKLKDRAAETGEAITKELLYNTILNVFEDSNIDLNAPAFIQQTRSGKRGTDVFAFIREHTNQNAGAVPR